MVTLKAATDHEIAEQWRLFAGNDEDGHAGWESTDGALGGRATGTEDLDIPPGAGGSWPDDEAVAVIAALRLLVERQQGASGGRHRTGEDTWAHRVAERAGRRWSDAHGSPRLMRERLLLLPQVIGAGSDPGGAIAIERAVRVIADHAADEALDRLEQAALVDPLTGAGNRRALHTELTRTLAQMGRFGQRLAVVMVDLDGLKETNDREGHAAGDRALVSLAGSFASHLRAGDALYRIGGDEFVAVLAGASAAGVPALLERVAAGAPPFSWGMATTSDPAARISDLLNLADTDLYQRRRAKRSGAALALIAGGDVGGSTPRVVERARRRTRAASAALVAGLALAGGAAPALETGALHVALPPEPHPTRSGQPPVTAPVEPPTTTPGTVAPPARPAATVPSAASVARSTPDSSASLAGQSGSLVAIRSTTVPTTVPSPPPAPRTAPTPAPSPAPTPSPTPGRSTTAPTGGGVVGTVVSTVATDVSTTVGGVGAVVGDLLGHSRPEGSSAGAGRYQGAHTDAAPQDLSLRTVQATPQGRPTWSARWRSHSRGR